MEIDWTKQHCGVHRASFKDLYKHMRDVHALVAETFPENPEHFTWDVKVHMLMPSQFPCIPNWHYDNVPRINNKQDFSKIQPNKPMYLWLSGEPLTEFKRKDGSVYKVNAEKWHRFTQKDLHRGTVSFDFQWRGFIRATHRDIMQPQDSVIRRHCQVYLDAESFRW